jgi:hypothetical protein
MLDDYQPEGAAETADVARTRALTGSEPDPWLRTLPLHVTASALIVHPDSGRVLLRWHRRQQAWLQVGGHLVPWPDARIRHVAIVGVPEGHGEPAHEHADVRFLLATRTPDAVVPEGPDAPLRWLSVADAEALTTEANLLETLARARRSLAERS